MPITLPVLNGQIGLLSQQNMLAANGSLFAVNTPSPGTGVAYAQLTSFSATANGLFMISNPEPVGGRNVYLNRLDLFETAAIATGTTISFEAYNETGTVTATTAVATRTPVNVSGGAAFPGVVQFFSAGAMTIPAAVGTRVLQGQAWIPVGLNVIKDNYSLEFGGDTIVGSAGGATAVRAVDTARKVGQMGAVVIKPQTTSWVNMWGLGTSTPSFEYNLIFTFI